MTEDLSDAAVQRLARSPHTKKVVGWNLGLGGASWHVSVCVLSSSCGFLPQSKTFKLSDLETVNLSIGVYVSANGC